MVVQHNLTAMNSNRMLGATQNLQAKSSEKLSSGYRINRAADDAAGLSISEKMRKQINGLDQASTNAQDGVSAVQTAEGALTEVHSMLQRMNELAVQAANGTNSLDDRTAIQNEIDQLTTEIDRVAETTKFNETYLLKGAADGASTTKTVAAHDAGLLGKLTDNGNGTSTFALNEALKDGDKVTIAGKEYTIGDIKDDEDFMLTATATAYTSAAISTGDKITSDGVTKTVVDKVVLTDYIAAAADNDTFIDATGKEWTVSTDTTTNVPTDEENGIINANDVSKLTNLLQGATLTTVGGLTSVNETSGEYKVVDKLDATELSSLDTTAVDTVLGALEAGDVVTIGGVTTELVDNEPMAFDKMTSDIMKVGAGATVDVDGITYTVGDVTDDTTTTREDIIAKIGEKSEVTVTDANVTFDTITSGDTYTVYGVEQSNADNTITVTDAYAKMAEELTAASSIGTDKAATVVNNNDGTFTINQGSVEVKDILNFNLQVGADADMTNKINVNIEAMDAANLGVKNLNVADDTGMAATYAIDAIADAVAKVSAQRSALGAIQNRLEHTIANLDNVVENTTAAESRIRDTDMAEEMVEYSKNNILAQAGQSMLAQANQSTQGVLSLLG